MKQLYNLVYIRVGGSVEFRALLYRTSWQYLGNGIMFAKHSDANPFELGAYINAELCVTRASKGLFSYKLRYKNWHSTNAKASTNSPKSHFAGFGCNTLISDIYTYF